VEKKVRIMKILILCNLLFLFEINIISKNKEKLLEKIGGIDRILEFCG